MLYTRRYAWVLSTLVALLVLPEKSRDVLALEIFPPITLRAGVLHAPPFAMIDENPDGSLSYTGFQIDLLKRLQIFAAEDNIELEFVLSHSPPQYGAALDLVASDCNTTENPNPAEDCNKFDIIVGDYYCNPARSVRVDFTPSWLRTTMSTVKFLDKVGEDFTTLSQASGVGATVCVPEGTYLMSVVMEKFPDAEYIECPSPAECISELKAENCVLYADDELLLHFQAAKDGELEVTREKFNTQYLVWPMKYALGPEQSLLMKKWMYAAVSNATLDELYFKYFQKELCPVGTAGEHCELPCDPNHGTSDKRGVCVCESTRWTGPDCSIEVEEELHLIPSYLKVSGFVLFGINATVCIACAVWLHLHWKTPQVRVSQPLFLYLVLAGCLISSSTIIALSAEDSGYGPVPACMAVPWLYSVGFCITFGTLFGKILRVYRIFKSAAAMQRKKVTASDTIMVICGVLLLDAIILIVWTIIDPLEWRRTVLVSDKYGHSMESEGHCESDYWVYFFGIIGFLHLCLMSIACYLCYVSRHISTKFSEGKYVAIAMTSNLQIFIVGVPIIILLVSDPITSYFVKCAIVGTNDFMVIALIFGNLIKSVHFGNTEEANGGVSISKAMNKYNARSRVSRVSRVGLESERVMHTANNVPSNDNLHRSSLPSELSQIQDSPPTSGFSQIKYPSEEEESDSDYHSTCHDLQFDNMEDGSMHSADEFHCE